MGLQLSLIYVLLLDVSKMVNLQENVEACDMWWELLNRMYCTTDRSKSAAQVHHCIGQVGKACALPIPAHQLAFTPFNVPLSKSNGWVKTSRGWGSIWACRSAIFNTTLVWGSMNLALCTVLSIYSKHLEGLTRAVVHFYRWQVFSTAFLRLKIRSYLLP